MSQPNRTEPKRVAIIALAGIVSLACVMAVEPSFKVAAAGFQDVEKSDKIAAEKVTKLGGTVVRQGSENVESIVLFEKNKGKVPLTDSDIEDVDFAAFT